MEQIESRIDLYDSAGKQKNVIDLVDRISILPDSILGIILSFLPTTEAVATSILSERWKFMWVNVYNLDFYYNHCFSDPDEDLEMRFVRFVDRVLLLHDAGFLKRFSLVWHSWSDASHVSSWISYAITKNVHELSLCLYCTFGEYDMATSFLTCESLRYLELIDCGIYVSDALVVCLPRLESLKVDKSVSFESKEACEKLISGCPMLHYLQLNVNFKCYRHKDASTCIISSASLRRLEICFRHKSILKLNASSLEYLKVRGEMSDIFVEISLSSLVQADINIVLDEHDRSNNSIAETVRALDCANVSLFIGEIREWI